jgi:hypothetical protein
VSPKVKRVAVILLTVLLGFALAGGPAVRTEEQRCYACGGRRVVTKWMASAFGPDLSTQTAGDPLPDHDHQWHTVVQRTNAGAIGLLRWYWRSPE